MIAHHDINPAEPEGDDAPNTEKIDWEQREADARAALPPIPAGPGVLLAIRPGMMFQADMAADNWSGRVVVSRVTSEGLWVYPLLHAEREGELVRIGWDEVTLLGCNGELKVVGVEHVASVRRAVAESDGTDPEEADLTSAWDTERRKLLTLCHPVAPGPGVMLAVRPGMVVCAEVDGGDNEAAVVVEATPAYVRVRSLCSAENAARVATVEWKDVTLWGSNGSDTAFRLAGPEMTLLPGPPVAGGTPATGASRLHEVAAAAAAAATQADEQVHALGGTPATGDTAEAGLALELAARALLRLCGRLDDAARAEALEAADAPGGPPLAPEWVETLRAAGLAHLLPR